MSSATQVTFPILFTNEDGEKEQLDDIADIECNIEDFNSDRRPDCTLIDAMGQEVFLIVETTWIRELRLKP